MAKAKIYKPSRSVTQSGCGKDYWLLEFISCDKKYNEILMHWVGSKDTKRQLSLKFKSLEDAKNYATKHNISFIVKQQQSHSIKPKAYADNFK